MGGDLSARGSVAMAQPAHQVFARLGQEGQYRLVAALALVLGVVTVAPAHLAAVERVHGGVGVQRHRLQFHLGRGPDSFPQLALQRQDLLRHVEMQRGQKAPQCGLRRQTGHLQDAGQDGVAGDEAQLVEPRKADIEAQHEGQHELVGAHGWGDPFGRDGLFQQRLEAEFFEQGGDGQQAAVGSQLLAAEVIGRGSPDFIGPRGPRSAALFDGPWGAMLFSIGNHLGDLLGVGWRSWNLCQPTFYPMFSGVPQWSLAAQPSSAAPAVHNSGTTIHQMYLQRSSAKISEGRDEAG